MISVEEAMELLDFINHMYLLAFSLVGREEVAKRLLKDTLAYSDRFTQLIEQKGVVLIDHFEIEDFEDFLLSYFQKEYQKEKISQKKHYRDHIFFKMKPINRFKLCKFDIESKEKDLLLKKDFIEPIIEFGLALGLRSFKEIDREQTECPITRTALIRLLQTKHSLSFREHTHNCKDCFEFQKQYQKDMNLLQKEIQVPSSVMSSEELEDLIFMFKYPVDDYAYKALHEFKKIGKNLINVIS